MSLFMIWGLFIYISNLYSILSCKTHYRIIELENTYQNYLLKMRESDIFEGNTIESEKMLEESSLENGLEEKIKQTEGHIDKSPFSLKFFTFKDYDYKEMYSVKETDSKGLRK